MSAIAAIEDPDLAASIDARQQPNPAFDRFVTPNGYQWWYIDAISEDKRHALTIIVFIGSVFSPYYKHARGRGSALAQNHCAVNVALYGRGGKRWAMTERGVNDLDTSRETIAIGRSSMHWNGDDLILELDEICMPVPTRIRGQVRLRPRSVNQQAFPLDTQARHLWQPIFPCADVEVRLAAPALRWHGEAYFDTNCGSVPLEEDFHGWQWSRQTSAGSEVTIIYDRELLEHGRRCLALRFDRNGEVSTFDPTAAARLPTTAIWRIPRAARRHPEHAPGSVKTLEDTPFYARSLLLTEHRGKPVNGVHESLSMRRFNRGWVRMLLPFRMPRIASRQRQAAARCAD